MNKKQMKELLSILCAIIFLTAIVVAFIYELLRLGNFRAALIYGGVVSFAPIILIFLFIITFKEYRTTNKKTSSENNN